MHHAQQNRIVKDAPAAGNMFRNNGTYLSDQRVSDRPLQRKVVQRMQFRYEKEGKLDKKSAEKLKTVNSVLRKTVSHFGGDKGTVVLKLINEGGMSPAFSNHRFDHGNQHTGDVLVTLNKWYLERASVGEIVGMLTHELGVHTMADFHMGTRISRSNKLVADNTSLIAKERIEEKYHDLLKRPQLKHGPYPVAKIDRKVPDRREVDHVNIAKGLITEAVKSRAQVYISTFLMAGDALWLKSAPKERRQNVRAHIQAFFFDIARLVATDDGTAFAMFRKTAAIAELMNFYYAAVVKKHSSKHHWLARKDLAPNASGWGLRGMLLGLIGKLMISSNPSVKRGYRSALAGGAAALGASALGLTMAPALGVGALVGGTVWGISKALGY
jgi:hypothetical protein